MILYVEPTESSTRLISSILFDLLTLSFNNEALKFFAAAAIDIFEEPTKVNFLAHLIAVKGSNCKVKIYC